MYFMNEVVQNTFASKPFPVPDFKSKRLPQRKALTIIAGFRLAKESCYAQIRRKQAGHPNGMCQSSDFLKEES
jgi:hypothetical protein